jgi:hypothetical protein
MATLITVGFMVQTSLLVLQIPISWLTSGAIGAIAGAITLIGKQFNYIDLSQQTIWRLFGGVTVSSLAIGFITRAIIYAATKPIEFY